MENIEMGGEREKYFWQEKLKGKKEENIEIYLGVKEWVRPYNW